MFLCSRIPHIAVALAISFVILLQNLRADEIVLPASMDTTIFAELENSSNSAGSHFFSGATANRNFREPRRALLAFDIASSIPANATITDATLSLTVNRVPPAAVTNAFGLHAITQEWIEGSSDATGQEGMGGDTDGEDTTWISTGIAAWNTPGGDFAAEASATTDVAGLGAYTWNSPGLVADLQSWLADGNNFGWMLIGDELSEPKTAKRFASRTNSSESSRPSLSIQFEVPTSLQGDFSEDGQLLADDIGFLCDAIRGQQNPMEFDLDGNDIVDLEDLRVWVEDIKGTFFGDSDLNGEVAFVDFLTVSSQFGFLNPPEPRPVAFDGWSSGDYNCSDQVGFDDFLKLSANFGRSNNVANAASAPEPSTSVLMLMAMLGINFLRRRR